MKNYIDDKVVKILEKAVFDLEKEIRDPQTYQVIGMKINLCGQVIEILNRIQVKDRIRAEIVEMEAKEGKKE